MERTTEAAAVLGLIDRLLQLGKEGKEVVDLELTMDVVRQVRGVDDGKEVANTPEEIEAVVFASMLADELAYQLAMRFALVNRHWDKSLKGQLEEAVYGWMR